MCYFRCVARNVQGEAAATLKLNVVSPGSSLSQQTKHHGNDHQSLYPSITMDTSFLSIDPDVLTADVGAKAHFSCQGNAINQISIQGTTRGNEP